MAIELPPSLMFFVRCDRCDEATTLDYREGETVEEIRGTLKVCGWFLDGDKTYCCYECANCLPKPEPFSEGAM